MAKIQNFDSLTVLGAFLGASHIFAPMKVKFGTGSGPSARFPNAKFYVYRGNVSPLRGEKLIFGPPSKNNTGMQHYAQACR